ncbi:MAG: sigma-70 family RNA polymerase sigma factor [Gemmataceae bacterium]
MPTGLPRPLASVARRLAPPPDGSDADLLARWVAARDEAAFEGLVRRHGPTVRAIARGRLGNPADADDVTQAAFLVLARDAAKVRESVAGWLARVAHLTALQHRRNMARRTTDALPADPPGPTPDPADGAATREDRAVVTEELAGLPDRLRAVLVLCGLEGRTNTEAAALLGVPKGTVDSRLAAAKKLLHARLARRGVTAAVAAVSLDRLAADTASAAVGFTDLAHTITANAGQYLTGTLDVSAVRLLADGVTPTMSSASRLIALAMLTVAVSGTAGLGLYHASAGPQEPKKEPPKAAKAEPPKPKDAPPPAAGPEDGLRVAQSEQEVRGLLAGPSGLRDLDNLTLGSLLDMLNARGVLAWVDVSALIRHGLPEDARAALYDTRLRGPRNPERLPLTDVLSDVLGQLQFGDLRLAFRVRGNQLVIGPAYVPPFLPGPVADQTPQITPAKMIEQLNGPPVSVVFANTSITKAVESLRRETGANIVLDPKVALTHEKEPTVTATFDDVRLRTVLQVVADVAGYRLVALDNVYYLTGPENAERMQAELTRPLHGGAEPAGQVLVPPGFVTDGYQYFPRTADMKPSDPFAKAYPGGGGPGGVKPVPAPPPAKKDEKK